MEVGEIGRMVVFASLSLRSILCPQGRGGFNRRRARHVQSAVGATRPNTSVGVQVIAAGAVGENTRNQSVSLLRLPRIHPGGSDRLPLTCFRLRDQRFPVQRGQVSGFPRAISGGSSTGRTRSSGGTLPVTSRASPSAVRRCLCGDLVTEVSDELYVSPAVLHRDIGTVMLVPVGPLYHGTPKQDGVVKVLPIYSHAGGRNRQAERASHPLTEDRGHSGSSL